MGFGLVSDGYDEPVCLIQGIDAEEIQGAAVALSIPMDGGFPWDPLGFPWGPLGSPGVPLGSPGR